MTLFRYLGFVFFSLLMISELSAQSPFPDSDYEKYNWKTFMEIELLKDSINPASPDYELLNAAVFFYTNQARTSKGLKPMKFSSKLRNMAALHSEEMGKYEFVDHYHPKSGKYKTPQKRGKIFDVEVHAENVASETVYDYVSGKKFIIVPHGNGYQYFYKKEGKPLSRHTYASFANALIQAWMNSPSHRANILHPDLAYMGCAVFIPQSQTVSSSIPQAYATQDFSYELKN